jgi:cohesin complex subunit SCC1
MNGDPARHLLGDKANASLDIFAGPIGLAPQLSSLFTFDAAVLRRRRGLDAEGERAAKRIRGSEELSEIGRRDVGAEQPGGLSGFGGLDDTWGDEGQDMMMDQEMPDFALGLEEDGLRRSTRKSRHADVAADDESETGRLPALSRLATPDDDDNEPAEDSLVGFSPNSQNPLAAFDARPADADKARAAQSGWSNNSIRALRVVRAQLDPAIAAELDDDELPAAGAGKTLSFEKVAAGASRRAAAGFFFELLVLGTKDLVMLEQQQPYEDIRVAAKPALWTLQSAPTPAAA